MVRLLSKIQELYVGKKHCESKRMCCLASRSDSGGGSRATAHILQNVSGVRGGFDSEENDTYEDLEDDLRAEQRPEMFVFG